MLGAFTVRLIKQKHCNPYFDLFFFSFYSYYCQEEKKKIKDGGNAGGVCWTRLPVPLKMTTQIFC